MTWLSNLPGHELPFNPALDLTQTVVHAYLFGELEGTLAVATTARYTQPNCEQMKRGLKDILL